MASGDQLPRVLALYLALEKAQGVRSRRVHLTALLSLPVAVLAFWPSLFSEVGRRAALTCWVLSACGALAAVWEEWRLAREVRGRSSGGTAAV